MPKYYIPKEKFQMVPYSKIKKYLELAPDRDFRICLSLAWLTGARIQEVINLKPQDIRVKNDIVMFRIDALKHGRVGFPTFSKRDYFMQEILHFCKGLSDEHPILSRGKRRYQQILKELNEKIHPNNESKWITFHYLRHSRITWLLWEQEGTPAEIMSWTGHNSDAFREYFRPRQTRRFAGKTK